MVFAIGAVRSTARSNSGAVSRSGYQRRKGLQVAAKENLPGIRKALEAGGNRDVQVVELPGLNHLFQKCATGAPMEYSHIEETFSPNSVEDGFRLDSAAHGRPLEAVSKPFWVAGAGPKGSPGAVISGVSQSSNPGHPSGIKF